MAKYSYEIKKEIVDKYLKGEYGYRVLAKEYSIPSKRIIYDWVRTYKILGYDGLKKGEKNRVYSFDFKLHVVELYLTGNYSYSELGYKVSVSNSSIIRRWVKDYKRDGIDGLKSKKRGREPNMDKLKSEVKKDQKPKDLKELEEENLKLKIENSFLKELRRLRLEKEHLNKKRE